MCLILAYFIHPSIHQNLRDLFVRTHDLHFRKATYVCLVEISKLGFHMASFSKARPGHGSSSVHLLCFIGRLQEEPGSHGP